ncbi:MAG: LD-carboxypeptidase family protein [Candidatus Xenolissoclinum pacificiensis L6]|uniref:LD-carboxypeptidase family protein n=1 Tax=Candidatus Xenolissoclinum pacificiensis L6 TaxID=1401685 RepID=W2V1Q8_9RICK|nr:MAG: LD-carboxypeptidase family protein [Candidatus Xenolissoclinum pacificiensis L6]
MRDYANYLQNRINLVIDNVMWFPLQVGDTIDLIAPSSAPEISKFEKIANIITSFGYIPSFKYSSINPISEYSNKDNIRAKNFHDAMNNTNSKAVWVIRGGAGSTRLWHILENMPPIQTCKPFIGFSDATGLHSYLHTIGIPTIHGITAEFNKNSGSTVINNEESMEYLFDILTGKYKTVSYQIEAINQIAQHNNIMLDDLTITGGNITLVIASLGSIYSPNTTQNSILILESVGETPHQLDRWFDALIHGCSLLSTTNMIKAIVIGSTLQNASRQNSIVENQNYNDSIERFSNIISNIPVYRGHFFGHDAHNKPIVLGSKAKIFKTETWNLEFTVPIHQEIFSPQ